MERLKENLFLILYGKLMYSAEQFLGHQILPVNKLATSENEYW